MASALYPVLAFLSPPRVPEATTREVEAGRTNDPDFLGKGFKIIRFGSDPVIVIKAGEGDFRAFAATCTHLDCVVEYRPEVHLIWCNCHNGQYDLTGRNVGGPPPAPLAAFQVHQVPDPQGGAALLVVSKA